MRLIANIAAVVLFILGGIAIVLGLLFIIGSGNPSGSPSWLGTGAIITGFGILFAIGGLLLQAQSQAGSPADQRNPEYRSAWRNEGRTPQM